MEAKLEPPVRAQLGEPGDDVLVEAAADACLESDAEHSRFLVGAAAGLVERLLPFPKQRPAGRQERATRRGELDAAPVAAEERAAQLALELADRSWSSGCGCTWLSEVPAR